MAILSLFALTLLSSAHASLELPSASEATRNFQRRYSSATKALPLQKGVETSVHQMLKGSKLDSTEVHLMQGTAEECAAAMELPCVAGAFSGAVTDAMSAASANASVEIVTDLCMNCTDAAGEFATYINVCNITNEETAAGLTSTAMLVDGVCADPECGGSILWGLANMDEDDGRDAVCMNLECGMDLFDLFLGSDTFPNATDDNDCALNSIRVGCLTDDDDTSIYCSDIIDGGDGLPNVTEVCATSCTIDVTLLMEDLYEEQCFEMEDDEEECTIDPDYMPFQTSDLCTENDDGEFCFAFDMEALNTSECEIFDLVPAPGGAVEDIPANCSMECTSQLQEVYDTIGCCIGTMFDVTCTDPAIPAWIMEECGIMFDTCERPSTEETTMDSDSDEDDDQGTSGVARVGGVAAVFVASVVAFVALS